MMTQCITAAVLFGTGDIIAQQAVEGKGRKHDVSKKLTWRSGSLPCCFLLSKFGQFVWLVDFR
jgi:hypothetical protein